MAKKPLGSINNQELQDLLNVIQAYAGLNFNPQLQITGKDDTYDAIACGINMLGEELNESTISLKEKELLLQEIHHRVKNNLQIISSLLNLQASKAESKEFTELINNCQTRIKSMSLVHEQLYESKNFKGINFSKYLEELCAMLEAVHSESNHINIVFNCDKVDLFLSLDLAIPLGLIVTELVTNSYKHAFPNESTGNIEVSMVCEDSSINYYKLTCRDNGIGFSDKNKNSASLGLELIGALSEQISATVNQRSSKKGTVTEISLKAQNKTTLEIG